MKTAHADEASKPAPISSCQAPPGVSDHLSNHGVRPVRTSRSATRLTTVSSRRL